MRCRAVRLPLFAIHCRTTDASAKLERHKMAASCGAFTRSWVPAKRFRTAGTYTATLRAIDKSQRSSRVVHKSLHRS